MTEQQKQIQNDNIRQLWLMVVMGVMFFFGFAVGTQRGMVLVRQEAIKAGAGKWTTDDNSPPQVIFQWQTNKPIDVDKVPLNKLVL